MFFFKPGVEVGQHRKFVGLGLVVIVEPSGHPVRADGDDHARFVLRHGADAGAEPRELGLELVVEVLGLFVEVVALGFVGIVGDAQKLFAQARPDDAAHAGFVVLVEQFLFACGGVVLEKGALVASQV